VAANRGRHRGCGLAQPLAHDGQRHAEVEQKARMGASRRMEGDARQAQFAAIVGTLSGSSGPAARNRLQATPRRGAGRMGDGMLNAENDVPQRPGRVLYLSTAA
jgi:hypothetical protein